MERIKRPSLNLNWLPLSERKTLPTPRMAFIDVTGCGGYCAYRTDYHCIEELTGWDRRDGDVIVVSTAYGDYERTAATLAHEYRHLQQNYFNDLPRLGTCQPFRQDMPWEEAIRVFYRQPCEFDALLFEHRFAPEETNTKSLLILGRL